MQLKNSIAFILKCSTWTPPEPLRLSDSNYRASFHTKHTYKTYSPSQLKLFSSELRHHDNRRVAPRWFHYFWFLQSVSVNSGQVCT